MGASNFPVAVDGLPLGVVVDYRSCAGAWRCAVIAFGDHASSRVLAGAHVWPSLPVRADVPPSPEERRVAIERLLVWAHATGARWDGIEVQVDAAGNAAVHATRDLAVGESILAVPRHVMVIDDELAASVTGALDNPDPRDTLATWLALEVREPASPWRAYLDALPVQLPELPMFHEPGDRDAMVGTLAYATGAAHARDVVASYTRLSAARRAQISLAEFAWGCAIVKTRGFHAPGTFEHHVALIPLLDLLDHRLGDTTWSYDPCAAVLTVSTERTFRTGDAVHFPYSDHSNGHLLVHYGFTEPANLASEAALVFDLAADPEAVLAAREMLALPVDEPACVAVGARFDDRMVRAISVARLYAAGPAERARVLDLGLSPQGDVPWLGAAHEAAAFTLLATAAARALAALATSPPACSPRPWDCACTLVRAGERGVLEQVSAFARAVLAGRPWPEPAHVQAAASSADLLPAYLRFVAEELATTEP